MNASPKIIECPRDAMQGIHEFIPTDLKIEYHNALLKVGFDTLDFGSFVSPKAIPQLADTAKVLEGLDLSETATKLLAIVVNLRGAKDAASFKEIDYLGYPFSISETFQYRNSRKTIPQSVELIAEMQDLCLQTGKELVVYISMGFGNPYNDPWSAEIAEEWVEKMANMGIGIISLADTVGTAAPADIKLMFESLIPRFPKVEFGGHFHAAPDHRREKVQAAWNAGCRRFDVAMMGFGGCPFAEDDLVGNIATESLLGFLEEIKVKDGLDRDASGNAMGLAGKVFG